jgi:ERCC4-type nuclease
MPIDHAWMSIQDQNLKMQIQSLKKKYANLICLIVNSKCHRL